MMSSNWSLFQEEVVKIKHNLENNFSFIFLTLFEFSALLTNKLSYFWIIKWMMKMLQLILVILLSSTINNLLVIF